MFSTRTLRGFVAAAVIAALPVAAFAQKEGAMSPKMEGKPAAGKMAMKSTGPVYVCKDGKMYYSAADAKKMGYKDPMGGGKLKKMAAPPKGGMLMHADSKMMGGKMMGDKKMGGKMMGDKKMGGDKPKM